MNEACQSVIKSAEMNTESLHGNDEQPAGKENESSPRAGAVLSTIADAPINILIVDDEPKNLTVLETVLDSPGYRLVRAESADQALLALVSEEFALLILDIRMPGMTGFELAQTIKGRKKTSRIPIIFLTAYYNEDEHVLEGYGSGAVDYLHKPVNATVLRSKVAVFAELHRKSREVAIANRALLAEVTERRRAEEQLRLFNDNLDRLVTERTRALETVEAELREADRRKDAFIATLAHELRNPLAPVRNAAQILQLQTDADAGSQRASEIIARQVGVMARLIDDLMDVSRINRGHIALRCEPVTLARVLELAVEATRPYVTEYGHELSVALPDGPILLDADVTRLSQVFVNLLTNAAKYTDRGGHIQVSVERDGGRSPHRSAGRRHRHPHGSVAQRVRDVRAGRGRDCAIPWRARDRPLAGQALRGASRRSHRGAQRGSGHGQLVRRHAAHCCRRAQGRTGARKCRPRFDASANEFAAPENPRGGRSSGRCRDHHRAAVAARP